MCRLQWMRISPLVVGLLWLTLVTGALADGGAGAAASAGAAESDVQMNTLASAFMFGAVFGLSVTMLRRFFKLRREVFGP